MAVSINDIAKAAKVSTATVSRVINSSPKISEQTRNNVLKVMEKMNYVPNSLARGLSNKKALNVALVIDNDDTNSFYNPFFYEVMHGIETVVYEKGLCLIITSLKETDKRNTLEWLILGNRIQGAFIPNSIANTKTIRSLKERNFPFVGIGEISNYKEPLSWVDVNNIQGGEQAADHLLKQGYEKIAFIGGSQDKMFNKNRLYGYERTLDRNGIRLNMQYVKECNGSKQDAYEKMKQLLSLKIKPDSVICGDNIICFGAMKAISEIGLNIPNDVGMVSFDNYPLATLLEPSITSVNIDVFQMGEVAANILFNLINNPNANQQQTLISTNVEIRESTIRRNI